MKKNLIFIFAIFAIFLLSCDSDPQEKDTIIDVCTSMDDLIFMQYCYENFDVNKDGKVSLSEANAVKTISVPSKEIQSLKGIQHFENLTKLDCSNNSLNTLDVSHNSKLINLYCYGNLLTSLNVSRCTTLTSLDCHFNQLTNLIVSGCIAITYLDCQSNLLNSKALDSLYESLPTILSPHSGLIDISNNPGVFDCNIEIANDKGWIVKGKESNAQQKLKEEKEAIDRFIGIIPQTLWSQSFFMHKYFVI